MMQHFFDSKFKKAFTKLPKNIQSKVRKNAELLKENTSHPSLNYKKLGKLYSVRITMYYRMLGYIEEGDIIWFWVGGHDEYEKLIKKLN